MSSDNSWKPYASYPYSKARFEEDEAQARKLQGQAQGYGVTQAQGYGVTSAMLQLGANTAMQTANLVAGCILSNQNQNWTIGSGVGNVAVNGWLPVTASTVANPAGVENLESLNCKFIEKINKLKSVEPRKVTKRVPDSITPIIAWRGWEVECITLCSLGTTFAWEPGKRLEASCVHYGNEHRAPFFACTCGFWAFKTLDLLLPAIATYSKCQVVGTVALWGKVIETENGYRGQYACPTELWLVSDELAELGIVYNCPVRMLDNCESV